MRLIVTKNYSPKRDPVILSDQLKHKIRKTKNKSFEFKIYAVCSA